MTQLACCGLDCETCTFREKTKCPGCHAAKGKTFWGRCTIAECCLEKQHLTNCGQCRHFPCDRLKAFAFDETHGDNGHRIENLKQTKPKS